MDTKAPKHKSIAVVIPARYESTRFPGKPLVKIKDKEMVLWVADQSSQAVGIENVYIATDSNRIRDVVQRAGYKTVMTSSKCLTGTDRVAEAAKNIDAEIIINVQGDEPLVSPFDILSVLEEKINYPNAVINAFSFIRSEMELLSENTPKVVMTEANKLLYMSRSVIPGSKSYTWKKDYFRKQVCIYAFNQDELHLFESYGGKTQIEECEDIEILRFLDLGIQIKMIEAKHTSIAVDSPSDVERVLNELDAK